MRVLAFLPVAAAVVSTKERIESMKATFRGVAESAVKNGGKIEQTTKDAIQGWMDTMNSTLAEALIVEANDYQLILNNAYDNVEGCMSTRTATFANDVTGVTGHANARDAARTAHIQSKNCGSPCPNIIEGNMYRDTASLLQTEGWPSNHNHSYDTNRNWGKEGETAVYESSDATHTDELTKTTCETLAFDDQQTKCTTLDDHVKALTPVTPKAWCTDASATTHENRPVAHPHTTSITQRSWNSWEAQDTSSDPVYTWFHAMDQWDVAHVDLYNSERLACHDARRAHQHRAQKTYALQRAFESAYCAWTNSIAITCHVYEGCYASTTYTHGVVSALVTRVETQIKAQQAALECVLCYGNQILQDNTNLDACDTAVGCQNCSPLDIEYKVPHTENLCGLEDQNGFEPCVGAWTHLEYGCFRATEPADDCTPCTPPVLPAWPANATAAGQ